MLWIVLEWWIWGFVALSNIYFVLGLVEAVVAHFCLRKRHELPGRMMKGVPLDGGSSI
jgi:hypothetical protein